MTLPRDLIARRAAARLGPRVAPRLPTFVELALAPEGCRVEPPDQFDDTANLLAAARLLVTTITLVLNQYNAYRAERDKQAQGEPLTAAELAALRELLVRTIRSLALPSDVPSETCEAIVAAVVEETLAEATQPKPSHAPASYGRSRPTSDRSKVASFIGALLGAVPGTEADEIADVLWLAAKIGLSSRAKTRARLDAREFELPFGPLTVPEAPAKEPAAG